MGVGHLQITKNGDTITATTTQAEGGSQHYQVNNLDELVNKLSGLALPVSQLRYWIKGMPDPNQRHHDARYDANNNLVSVHQQDWNLEWDRFKTQQGLQLPHKIKATQLKGGSLKVTLIIAQWQL